MSGNRGVQGDGATVQELFGLAQRLEAAGRAAEALEVGRDIVRRRPDWGPGYYAVGSAQCALGLIDEADSSLRKAIARDGKQAGFYMRHAEVLNRLGHHEEAVETIERGVAVNPDDGRVLGVKAMVLWLGGDPAGAYACVDGAIGRGVEDPRLRSVRGQLAAEVGRLEEGIAELEGLRGEKLERMLRSEVLMALAKLYDKAGRYDEAFSAAREGGGLRETGYDPGAVRARCDDRIRAWSAERIAGVPASRVKTEKPVFIIGMPRSGTSLVEQIIASHPAAYGAGELLETKFAAHELSEPNELVDDRAEMVAQIKPAALDRCARRVLKSMEKAATREKGKGVERITDKLPNNYEYVGLIGKMFPGAKIIHCVRNPRDTCVSCFLLDFVGDRNHGYSYDLGHLAHQYKVYERYMEHWRAVSPIEMLEVRYEELVERPEEGARRIIEYIGLDWDERCGRPHETKRAVSTLSSDQVRRPVYTGSRERWRNYEGHIGVLIETLGTGG